VHAYEVRPRKDRRGVNLISDALPFGRLWYGEPKAASNAVDYAKFRSRSHRAVIRVSDAAWTLVWAPGADFRRYQRARLRKSLVERSSSYSAPERSSGCFARPRSQI
jgi:hypothetical protein